VWVVIGEEMLDEVGEVEAGVVGFEVFGQGGEDFEEVPVGECGDFPVGFDDGLELAFCEEFDSAAEVAFFAFGSFG